MTSAFGIDHGGVSKAASDDDKKKAAAVAGGGVATAAVLGGTKMPEQSHFSRSTRAHLKKLPPGVHEVDTKMLQKRPRKLGARKQQAPYVAAMAQERPTPYSPVPITRYKDGPVQRDNAHSVMANSMKGRKTLIKIEDADGYRPSRRTGEELVRRAQGKYQEHRLKRHTDLPEKKINSIKSQYKPSSRAANTSKRPHGVVEEGFKMSKKPYGIKRALSIAKADRDEIGGAVAGGGFGLAATTPVRRSAKKVNIKNGQMSAKDAKKVLSPGYRPGNTKNIQTMAANLGHLEDTPTTVIRYKDGGVIPFDGNHRGTARVARGDKSIPVNTIEGGERPAVSVGRNLLHTGQQKLHQKRMDRGDFKPVKSGPNYTGKHTGERAGYKAIANGSAKRSGKRVSVGSTAIAQGPSKTALRTRQGATLAGAAALVGGGAAIARDKKKPFGVDHG